MQYIVLTTGSCGNCYILVEKNRALVIDAGVTYKKFSECLKLHDIDPSSVEALFITHLHPDHSKGAGALMRKLKIPVYISKTSKTKNKEIIIRQKIEYEDLKIFDYLEEVQVGPFTVKSFQTSHDSIGSCGYFISVGEQKVFLMTDTGIIPNCAEELAKQSSLKFVEANYDEVMLENGPYSRWLIDRVAGRFGHLSNRESVSFVKKVSKQGDHVVFVHLSENNNKPEILKKMAFNSIDSGVFLKIAERGASLEGFIE